MPSMWLVEILDDLDGAAGALPVAVAGDSDKIEGGVGLDRAGEIDEKEGSALEDADHDQLFAVEVTGDLSAISATRSAICWRE